MTKEQVAYAATLNLLGSAVLDPRKDRPTLDAVARLREAAEDSTLPRVHCGHCPALFARGGPRDGEHFADLWEHLIAAHHIEPHMATDVARLVWGLGIAA